MQIMYCHIYGQDFWDGVLVDLSLLKERISGNINKIASVSYCVSPDIKFKESNGPETDWEEINIDGK